MPSSSPGVRRVLLALMLAFAPAPVLAQSRPYIPPRGSVERQQIMEAFRVPVARYFGRAVIFQHVVLRVQDGWAFVQAEPRTPAGGEAADLHDPRCQPNCTEVAIALLRWNRGRWSVVRHAVSPGEYPREWQSQFRAVPQAVWPWNWPSVN